MVIGHQKQWQFLKKSAEMDKLSHGMLFYGDNSLGKKTLAIEFIKLLYCQKGPEDYCDACKNCKDIQKMQHPDLFLIEPQKKEIQISQIRDLIWKLSLRPYSAPFKSAIIDRAHLMNQEAQSCFLKNLEEPTGRAILILITEYPETLLPTIISRVQKIKFYPVKKTEIENYLLKRGDSKEMAEKLASLSLGRPGLAINFFLNPAKLKKQEQIISDLQKITKSPLASRFQYAKELTQNYSLAQDDEKNNGPEEGWNLKEVLNIWLSYFRDILLSASAFTEDGGTYRKYPLNKIKKIIQLIQRTDFLISTTNTNPRLALEILMLEL